MWKYVLEPHQSKKQTYPDNDNKAGQVPQSKQVCFKK